MNDTCGLGKIKQSRNATPVETAVMNSVASRIGTEAAVRSAKATKNASGSRPCRAKTLDGPRGLAAGEVRWDRVVAIQALIAGGSYYVSTTDLAGRLMVSLHS